jgi:hypothetical protein
MNQYILHKRADNSTAVVTESGVLELVGRCPTCTCNESRIQDRNETLKTNLHARPSLNYRRPALGCQPKQLKYLPRRNDIHDLQITELTLLLLLKHTPLLYFSVITGTAFEFQG